MATLENEQYAERLTEVKRELAKLRVAIKEKEQASVGAAKPSKEEDHKVTELFAQERKVKEQHDILVAKLVNRDKDGTAEQMHSTLDVSPGDHTVVELKN